MVRATCFPFRPTCPTPRSKIPTIQSWATTWKGGLPALPTVLARRMAIGGHSVNADRPPLLPCPSYVLQISHPHPRRPPPESIARSRVFVKMQKHHSPHRPCARLHLAAAVYSRLCQSRRLCNRVAIELSRFQSDNRGR